MNSQDFLTQMIAKGRVESIDGVPLADFLARSGKRPKTAPTSPSVAKAQPVVAQPITPNPERPKTAKQAREAKAGPVNPEVPLRQAKAKAVLVIQGRAVYSTNKLQWKHWTAKHAERDRAAEVIQGARWSIPFGSQVPAGHGNTRQHLVFVWYGRKLMDRANLANGCKGLLDELVKQGFLVDDNPHWLMDEYFPELDSRERLEILFGDPVPLP